MAQFLTVISILLFLVDFKPIVSERRDLAPYIDSAEHSPQYLVETMGNRSKKINTPNKEQPTTPAQTENENNVQQMDSSRIEETIRSIFATDFGPGLHLFNNTTPFTNDAQSKINSDIMFSDQPHPHSSPPVQSLPSSSSPTDNQIFKIQRSPDGTLNYVFNESFTSKEVKDTKVNHAADKQTNNSNKENAIKKFQNHLSAGRPLKKGSSLPAASGEKSGINDCLREDEIRNNKTYCSSLRNYPKKDHLEELIQKKFSKFEAFFGEDLIVPETIDHRMGNDPNEESFCRSHQVVIYPQSGQNQDYEWFYIVNSDKFKQGIRIEECLDPFKSCGEHVGLTLPSNYDTSCEQHYIYRTLVAYDESKDSIFKETFRLPACCKCILRNNLKIQ